MDKQIIQGLNIYAKYNVDDDRIDIRAYNDGMTEKEIRIYFTGFKGKDRKKLKELGWKDVIEGVSAYYYHEV